MKKTKILLPLVSLAATIGVVTPLVTLASCNKESEPEPEVKSTLCVSDTGILAGFRADATEDEIKAEFGDTFTIPKDVRLIAENAFVKDGKTTIPSTIKHFRFEDGYKCQKIDSFAFYGAPFETVELTCNRLDGVPPEGSEDEKYCRPTNPDDRWGLKELGFMSFFNTQNLKYVKIAGSVDTCGKMELPDMGEQAWVFGVTEDGEFPTNPYEVTCNVETVDLSDYYLAADYPFADNLPSSNFSELFGNMNFSDEVPPEEAYQHKVLIRLYNGVDGEKKGIGDKTLINIYRAKFGLMEAQQFDEDTFKMQEYMTDGNMWRLYAGGMKANHYDTFNINSEDITGLSTTLVCDTFISYSTLAGITESVKIDLEPYYQFDMSKWEGSFGDKWRINIGSESAPGQIDETNNLSLTLDGQKLVEGTDYTVEGSENIVLSKELTQNSKLEIKVFADSMIDKARIVLSKAE